MKKFDFLVIGSGIAGLIYALEVSKLGSVAILTKEKLNNCNTDYAQGGIAAVVSDQDSFDEHIKDTFNAGAELGKIPIITKIINDGPMIIDYLIKIGTEFTIQNNAVDRKLENLSLTREGGHSKNRVAYAADSTGHMIMTALIHKIKATKNITVFENYTAVDLITQHHVPEINQFIARITCWGAYALNNKTGVIDCFSAKKTMLATGGASQVYAHTTNPKVSTGDGIAMAKLAGARIVNMEFIQFHPTAFFSLSGKTFLITEALRGEGAILKLTDGSTFMEKYHSLGCLAPRDIVSRSIEFEIRKRGEKHVLLDATYLDHNMLKSHFPYINKKLLKNNIDFTKEPIPVAPAAHYFCGGILTTIDGITDIKNLFAAGEVACTGLHGANRLASNSLLEAAVIAYRAAHHYSNLDKIDFPEIPEWNQIQDYNENEWVIISHNKEIIKTIMQGYVGISRSRRLLKYANNRINNIYTEIDNFYRYNRVTKEVIETRNLAITAQIIIRSALSRKESRGLHYMLEYPNKDDKNYKKDTMI